MNVLLNEKIKLDSIVYKKKIAYGIDRHFSSCYECSLREVTINQCSIFRKNGMIKSCINSYSLYRFNLIKTND